MFLVQQISRFSDTAHIIKCEKMTKSRVESFIECLKHALFWPAREVFLIYDVIRNLECNAANS